MKIDVIWNGIIVPAGQKDESEHQIAPSRVAYVDNVFMAGYEEKANRLITPVTVQESGGNAESILINKAIWDTGAVVSCISDKIARRENMKPVDSGVLATLTGQKEIVYYFLDIWLSKDILIPNVKVAGISMVGRDSDFVIGMDIISRGNLIVKNNNGKTELRFEMSRRSV